LKNRKVVFSGVPREVSNPWREAIEGGSRLRKKSGKEVSNPWREAIEEVYWLCNESRYNEFPILGGRLLKK